MEDLFLKPREDPPNNQKMALFRVFQLTNGLFATSL